MESEQQQQQKSTNERKQMFKCKKNFVSFICPGLSSLPPNPYLLRSTPLGSILLEAPPPSVAPGLQTTRSEKALSALPPLHLT